MNPSECPPIAAASPSPQYVHHAMQHVENVEKNTARRSLKMPEILTELKGKNSNTTKDDRLENGECDGNQNNALLVNGDLKAPDEEKPLTKIARIEQENSTLADHDFGSQLRKIKINDQVRELQTILRDRTTSRGDFIFYGDRLIRLVVEEALNSLPYEKSTIKTPTGAKYEGLAFMRGNCGVSIMRSGEAMEKGLRDCCRSIRIGKILIKVQEETQKPVVYYAKFPPDIERRKVLLMYPLLNTGATVSTAINVLFEHGVKEENIIILTLFCTPEGVEAILGKFPSLKILTSEVHEDCSILFGQKYFGTDLN